MPEVSKDSRKNWSSLRGAEAEVLDLPKVESLISGLGGSAE